jgi:signal transduction histidine kinase
MLFGVNDALATAGVLRTPYLLDTGVVVPIVAVYWTITARFVDNARALHSMRARLEDLVAARTRELADAHGALLQSEKLAALGRFASGVAHEVSSPAAAVTANLRYLEGARPGGGAPGDSADAVREALASMERINGLVRKLVDAGRVASAAPGGTSSVGDAVRHAADEARQHAARVEIVTAVPGDLHVAASRATVAEVLSVLLANAADAAPAGRTGRVAVRAERRGATIRLTVSDDGVGMRPDVLRRAFDPFFSTKSHGHARGLGLAVARGLVEGNGGALWLESEAGHGTRAVLELPAASAVA